MRRPQAAVYTVLGCAGWVYLDLFARLDLPGAAWLAHLGFRALVHPLEWLTEDEAVRFPLVGGLWLLLSALCVVRPGRWRRRWWWLHGAALCSVQILTIAIAGLMERALWLGLLVGAALLLRLPHQPGPSRSRWLLPGLMTAGGLLAGGWLFALFTSSGNGYALIGQLGAGLAAGWDYRLAVGLLVGLLALLGGWLGRGRPGRAGLRRPGLGLALLGGVLVAGASEPWLVGHGPRASALWLVPGCLLGLWGLRQLLPARPRWVQTPLWLAPLTLIAALLIGHCYSFRLFSCPQPDDLPGFTRLAQPPQAFRVVPDPAGRFVALSLRAHQRIVHIHRQSGRMRAVDAGPSASVHPLQPLWQDVLPGAPEELVPAPEIGRWFATVTPGEVPEHLDLSDAQLDELTNLLLILDAEGARVLGYRALPGMCWINTMEWDPEDRILWLGCEERAGLYRYDPVADELIGQQLDPALGDVQALAFEPDDDRFYSLSLWRRPVLAAYRGPLALVEQRRVIGGSHYDLALDPASDTLFAAGWYASRVRVIETEGLLPQRSLAAGFGVRSLAVDPARNLLLAGSTYDGVLRVYDAAERRQRAALPVGGHVRHLSLDSAAGRAWLWSQCGLFEVELDALLAGLR